jgi:Protein of unknown function (DUF2939)
MKWAAGIFVVILYLVWPYYTLIELAGGIRSGDVQTINRLVDWDHVRKSVKTQIGEYLDKLPKTSAQRAYASKNPEYAAYGNTLAQSFANTLVDRLLTPKGIARLINSNGRPYRVAHGWSRRTTVARRAHHLRRRISSLWRRVSFAFFVSPIHFRLDLRDTDRAFGGTASQSRPTLTVLLMFKGTGWQVWDVRLSGLDMSPRLALAPRLRSPVR